MYTVIGYEDRMVQVYAAADLIVTRAGASTIAELTTVGLPSILVPWAGSADDHQTDNARILADVGAAVWWPSRISRPPAGRVVELVRSDHVGLGLAAAAGAAATAAARLVAAHRRGGGA